LVVFIAEQSGTDGFSDVKRESSSAAALCVQGRACACPAKSIKTGSLVDHSLHLILGADDGDDVLFVGGGVVVALAGRFGGVGGVDVVAVMAAGTGGGSGVRSDVFVAYLSSDREGMLALVYLRNGNYRTVYPSPIFWH
jgi:hypothetical protein